MEPSVWAISSRDTSLSFAYVGSGVARGEREALFSVATIDNGRVRAPVEPREVGRCCHDKVGVRDSGIAMLGDGLEGDFGPAAICGRSGDIIAPFSCSPGVVDGAPFKRCRASCLFSSQDSRGRSKSGVDVTLLWLVGPSAIERIEAGVLVFDEGSFVGDSDLARSTVRSS